MSAELAASERLNYLSKKQRAVSSRHSRLIINANNGNLFYPGEISNIQIPGNQAATYMDFQNSYLRFTIYNNDDTTVSLASGYDLIERLEILADGQTISNIDQYGAVVDQYMTTEVGSNWKNRFGRATTGTCENPFAPTNSLSVSESEAQGATFTVTQAEFTAGNAITKNIVKSGGYAITGSVSNADGQPAVAIASGETLTLCLPLVLTPFFSVNKYIPLVGRSNIQIRITWARAPKAFFASTTGLTDSQIQYTPVDFITSTVRLSADANAMVMANTGGRFELVASDIRTARTNSKGSESGIAVNCGFSFSSLDRISFSFYPHLSGSDGTLDQKFCLKNKYCGRLKNYALAVNGEEYPRKRIDLSATNVSEALSEVGIAHRSLADFNHQSSIRSDNYYKVTSSAPPDGSTYDLIGDFVGMIDTEAMQPHTGDSLYSGLSTLGSVVQLVGEIDTNANDTAQTDLLVFAQYTMALTLDMNGTQTWVVSI